MRIGLISDTHLPTMATRLHPAVHQVFAGVDMILHAGDLTGSGSGEAPVTQGLLRSPGTSNCRVVAQPGLMYTVVDEPGQSWGTQALWLVGGSFYSHHAFRKDVP